MTPIGKVLIGCLIGLMITVTGCGSVLNTLPPPASPNDPTANVTLYIPEGLDVVSVDFGATLFSDVSGSTSSMSSTMGGRAFVEVYAVNRRTGDQFLLIYENIDERRRPIQIIKFEHATSNL